VLRVGVNSFEDSVQFNDIITVDSNSFSFSM